MTEAAFSESLAARLKRRRERLSLTQLAVANAVQVKRSTVAAWESSRRAVSAFHYMRLEKFFADRELGSAACEPGKAKP